MPGQDAIHAEGVVVERVSDRLVRVELANGHRLFGHGSMRTRERFAQLEVGGRVTLEVSPFDLSKGRVTFETNSI